MNVYTLTAREPDPEQPYIAPKVYHGQPRSIKETRRAQKGGRR